MSTEPHLFVIFGATGDLAARRLFPALFRVLDGDGSILGVATRELDDAGLAELAASSLVASGVHEDDARRWAVDRVRFQRAGPDGDLAGLRDRIESIEEEDGLPGNRVLYLAVPPKAVSPVIEGLGAEGLAAGPGWSRLVVEKPFGHDLDSARRLNDVVHACFDEDQVYRIDHYLGKETVQNLLVFRFTNPIFESVWSRDRVDRVEITVAETLDVEGRGRFYDMTGVFGDMMQSHLAQLLTLVAMEPPVAFEADAIRDEKVKVLRSVRRIAQSDVVIGQYDSGTIDGREIAPYREVDGVADDSAMPTYGAARIWIDNWRWRGVPFYLRTGKALARRVTQIVVVFRAPPVCLFHNRPDQCVEHGDVLELTLQPDEGFSLHIQVKDPDADDGLVRGGDGPASDDAGHTQGGHPLRTIPLDFSYADEFGAIPEAYDALIEDVLEGDQTLFVRADEAEESWRLFSPVLAFDQSLHRYPAGTWGPPEAVALLGDGRSWATGGRP